MALWLTLLKNVPWTNVISSAPIVAEGAKKLWKTVRQGTPQQEPPPAGTAPGDMAGTSTVAALQHRLTLLETAQDELHQQMLASSELIKTLAEQNAELVSSIQANRARVLWLAGAVMALGVLVLVLLFLR